MVPVATETAEGETVVDAARCNSNLFKPGCNPALAKWCTAVSSDSDVRLDLFERTAFGFWDHC